MTVSDALRAAAEALVAAGIHPDEARPEARALVLHAAGLTPEALRLRPDAPLSPAAADTLSALVARRARREPLAYLLGTRAFYGLTFAVSPAVLIPRPETEFVVEAVLGHLAGREAARVVDVGTGSGAIAVAVAAHTPAGVGVWATDLSAAALAVAAENATGNGVDARIRFAHGDLLAPVAEAGPFDVIASNPPYIAPAEIETLEPEVRDWEPCVALGTHPDALHFYRRLAIDAPPLLSPGGLLVVEVGQGQAEEVTALWEAVGLTRVTVTPDYAGIGRVVGGVRMS